MKIISFLKRGLLNSQFVKSELLHSRIRSRIIRFYCRGVSKDSYFLGFEFIGGPGLITGKNFFGNRFVNYFLHPTDPNSKIIIGDNVSIAPNVKLITISHLIDDSNQSIGTHYCKPIIIGSDCWLCAGSIILPGVEIESNCIIAAGSIVTKTCESGYIYGGTPAKKIRKISSSQNEIIDYF